MERGFMVKKNDAAHSSSPIFLLDMFPNHGVWTARLLHKKNCPNECTSLLSTSAQLKLDAKTPRSGRRGVLWVLCLIVTTYLSAQFMLGTGVLN